MLMNLFKKLEAIQSFHFDIADNEVWVHLCHLHEGIVCVFELHDIKAFQDWTAVLIFVLKIAVHILEHCHAQHTTITSHPQVQRMYTPYLMSSLEHIPERYTLRVEQLDPMQPTEGTQL